MAATHSRHLANYARPQKTLPITMPKKSSTTYNVPVSRVAMPPPELDETSTIYSSGRRSGTLSDISDDYESSRYHPSIDVMDELSERMNNVFDPTKMDRNIVKQAQASGGLNAKQQELAEAQALLQRRMKGARARIARFEERTTDSRDDINYITQTRAVMQAKIAKTNPELLEETRFKRQSRR